MILNEISSDMIRNEVSSSPQFPSQMKEERIVMKLPIAFRIECHCSSVEQN